MKNTFEVANWEADLVTEKTEKGVGMVYQKRLKSSPSIENCPISCHLLGQISLNFSEDVMCSH